VAARGLSGDVLTRLGAEVVALRESEIAGAIAAQALDAAEPISTLPVAVAHWAYRPGLMPGGRLYTFGARESLWAKLGTAEQIAIEGVVGEAFAHSQAEATARVATLRRIDQMRRWPVSTALPGRVLAAIEEAATATVEQVACHDAIARRMLDSARAFRSTYRDDDAFLGVGV
jgi:TRAP-type mannitol/chloroaromatic compound transport system substrate-binding protein